MLSPIHAPTVRRTGGKGPRGRRELAVRRAELTAAQGGRARKRPPRRWREDTIGDQL